MNRNKKENVEETYSSSEYTTRYNFCETYLNTFTIYVTNASLVPIQLYVHIKYSKNITHHHSPKVCEVTGKSLV